MDRVTPSGRGSSAQRIEAALMEDIAAGALRPGERLDETGLAERFGVSRTPVREALSRLTAQGILVARDKRGVQVAEYSREQLAQIFEAMHEIETVCARLASQRLSLLARAEIEAAQARCVEVAEAGDFAEYLRANEAFHLAIYKATGNPYIAELASDFRRRTGPFRAKKFATKEDLVASAKSHEDLLASIFSEDSQTASKGMRDHMTASFIQTLAAN
ncbi:MAG: GntR family transcriptional regulator [Rhodobacter sp.]|nr:GntR family transcriptional regulator [Rhodobacter sp.]